MTAVYLLAIFCFSKLVVLWAVDSTIDGKIVGSNFFRSNAFTWRHADMDKKLQISFTDEIPTNQVTTVVKIENDLWRETCEQGNCILQVIINEDASQANNFSFNQQQKSFVVESSEVIETLDFELLEIEHFRPWSMNYISTDWALHTNLLNSNLLKFSEGFSAFEDWNQNPALSLSQYLLQWDGHFYLDIAQNGYSYNGNYLVGQNIAWPPLWPLMWRATKMMMPGRTWSSVGMMLNIVLSLVGLGILYSVGKKVLGEKVEHKETRAEAGATLRWEFLPSLLLAFSPFAVFLSSVHSEALFIVCLLAFMWSLLSGKRWLAAVFLGLAGATRTVAVPLAVIFWLQTYVLERQKLNWKNVLQNLGLTAISWTGFLSFLFYIKRKFGTPLFDPLKIQQAWHYNVPGQASLFKFIRNLFAPLGDLKNFILNPYYSGLLINLLCLGLALWILLPPLWAKMRKRPVKYNSTLVTLALTSLILLAANFQTLLYQANYTLGRLALPAYAISSILLVEKLKSRRAWLIPGLLLYLVISAALYFWYAIGVVNGELPC